MLKIEPLGCANGPEIGYERKRRVKDDTKIFGLRNWKMEMLLIDMEKIVKRVLTYFASTWTSTMQDTRNTQ